AARTAVDGADEGGLRVSMRKERILVLDDEPGVADYLCDELGEQGYRVAASRSPREALSLIRAENYDLVISDVEMPEMRGLEFLAAVHTAKPDQLVLLMTAFGSIDLAVQAVKAGACDFVTKPFKIEVLCLALERAFRERQMRHEIIRLRTTLPEIPTRELIAKSA